MGRIKDEVYDRLWWGETPLTEGKDKKMSEAPEVLRFYDDELSKTLKFMTRGGNNKYVRADRIVELEAKLTKALEFIEDLTGCEWPYCEDRPDNWVVIKLDDGNDPHYRVLAGWSGGYLDGDSWRMNSGITKVEETKDYYYFSGSSGSTYRCGKSSYMLKMNNAGTWARLQELHGDKVELMPEDTDWMNMDWIIK